MKTINDYKETLNEEQLKWYNEIENHLLKNYTEYPFMLSYKRPTLKLNNKIFIMLGGGNNHFSIYSTDFDYVNQIKISKPKGLKFGKSAILFPLDKLDYLDFAKKICDDIVSRNR